MNLMEALRQSVKAEGGQTVKYNASPNRRKARNGLKDSARCFCRSPARRTKRPSLRRAQVAVGRKRAEKRPSSSMRLTILFEAAKWLLSRAD